MVGLPTGNNHDCANHILNEPDEHRTRPGVQSDFAGIAGEYV